MSRHEKHDEKILAELKGQLHPASLEAAKEAVDIVRGTELGYDHIELRDLTWIGVYEWRHVVGADDEAAARTDELVANRGRQRFMDGLVEIELPEATAFLRQLDAEGELWNELPLWPRGSRWRRATSWWRRRRLARELLRR